jgi:hypothetical protein
MTQPPDEKARGLSFDKATIQAFRKTVLEVCSEHPEVRSVVVTVDYAGGLNDANIDKALWLGADGPVKSIAAVLGSVSNTLRTLEIMFGRAIQLEAELRKQIQASGAEVVNQQKALHAVNEETKKASAVELADRVLVERLRAAVDDPATPSAVSGWLRAKFAVSGWLRAKLAEG